MRRFLDTLYLAAGALAGCCMVGLFGMVVTQICARLVGVFVPGTDQFSGYLLAGATFLALAYTFGTGGHIRVALIVENVPAGARRWLEIVSLVAATAIVGYVAWYAVMLVWQTYIFRQSSSGLVSIPLWIPQIVVPIGLSTLLLAVVDALVSCLRGGVPNYSVEPVADRAEMDAELSSAPNQNPGTLRGQ